MKTIAHLFTIGCLLVGLSISITTCGFKHKEQQNKVDIQSKKVAKPPLDSLQYYIDNYCEFLKEYEKSSQPDTKLEKKKTLSEVLINDLTRHIVGSKKITFKGIDYYVFVADMNLHDIRLHWKNPGTSKRYLNIGNLLASDVFKENKALMIANAGMYTAENNPKGLYVEKQGEELIRLDTVERNSNANFYLLPNGVFYVDDKNIPHVEITKKFWKWYKKDKSKVKIATQSGPMLVIDGQMHDKFRNHSPNLNIRNGVGIINDKKVVFAISYGLVNFYDFASFYKDIFGCNNALYLDGAISRIYLHDLIPNERSGNFGPMVSVVEK